jgi:hypothetical protein
MSASHILSVDGAESGTFPTLRAAEANAAHLAGTFAPHAQLRFELEFKWTLSDLEIHTAAVIAPDHIEHMEDLYVDR